MTESKTIGYTTTEEVSPMFCVGCGEDVNREVEPLDEDDLENFDVASCVRCGEAFYTSTEGLMDLRAGELDEIASQLRGINSSTIYEIIGDETVPEKAREKLYGIPDESDELADRLNQAAEILRGNGDDW